MTTTPSWVQDAVFYQIFPDRFARSEKHPGTFHFESWDTPPTPHGFKGGDLYGVAEKLDYLKDLGINALYLNPIFASGSNHRYHTFDYYAVDELLGGNKAFDFLLDKAHKKNIRIVLDGVFNHASRGFWQFHHVLENGESSPYKDWFFFDHERLQGRRPWGVYPGHHEQERLNHHEDSLTAIGYRGWWNLPALPKFNTHTPAVREFLFGVAEHWIRLGVDGWRLDVPTEIDDDSFWQEFRQRVRKINPEAYIVGEIWHEAQRWLQGDQYDAVMNYEVTKPCLAFFPKQLDMHVLHQQGNYHGIRHTIDAHEFANRIDHNLGLYKRDITFSQLNLLDSHDTPRYLSCVNGDKDALKMAYLFLFTYPGAPCIYYGNEVGVDGRHDPECRKSFPWDESKWDHDLLAYMRSLSALRKKHETLRRGNYKRLYAEGHVMAFAREHEGEIIITAFNTADSERTVELPLGKKAKALFGNPVIAENQVTIPARSGVVIK
ncbi:MAG TPA: glycoside hydrolase family 13 protein [Anaerolineales bacterium]|nr:glycoside hydrolase family 13 protein [Anaerolineales bacterium]HNN13033.1 glycoside hydrolase family 13 protein [Anaerolineales bacterium]HNO30487.1 glycoside hydrolase family 13 protein [Anaerolineales bacterium]